MISDKVTHLNLKLVFNYNKNLLESAEIFAVKNAQKYNNKNLSTATFTKRKRSLALLQFIFSCITRNRQA